MCIGQLRNRSEDGEADDVTNKRADVELSSSSLIQKHRP